MRIHISGDFVPSFYHCVDDIRRRVQLQGVEHCAYLFGWRTYQVLITNKRAVLRSAFPQTCEIQYAVADQPDELFIRFNQLASEFAPPPFIVECPYRDQGVPWIPDEEYLPRPRVKLPHYRADVVCRGELLREECRCRAFSPAGVLAVERLDGG